MFTIDRLNEIIKNTIDLIEKSKGEIFDIAENSRNECRMIEEDLQQIRKKTTIVIKEVEVLEKKEKDARYALMLVSRNIKEHSEEDIRRAYERANGLQLELAMKRSEEELLIKRRGDLERRLKTSKDTAFKAESLVSKVGIIMGYLGGDLQDLYLQMEDIKQKQYLGIKIIKAQEDERKRVAREIHDGPAQMMANLVIKSELCEKMIEVDKERAKVELHNLKEIARMSLGDMRKIIYDLRPMSLDDLGLVPTVQRFITNYNEQYDVKVDLVVFGDVVTLSSIIELAIFRIIQESLNNIRKHSGAENAKVKIEYNRDFISASIKDDGKGFDVGDVKAVDTKGGYGLMSMRERVELLNGKIDISSGLGVGTKIFVSIPLQEE